MPDALQRLFRSSNGHSASIHISHPSFKPQGPPSAEADWVWIEAKNATPGTAALAILKASSAPLTVREIHEKVSESLPEVSQGTIANVGTRALENGLITRDEEGRWRLAKPEKGAVIFGEYLWGPPSAFQMHELAAYRRNAIMHLLRQTPTGLQQAQLLTQLRQSEL